MTSTLRIIPLGGLGEIGKNMTGRRADRGSSMRAFAFPRPKWTGSSWCPTSRTWLELFDPRFHSSSFDLAIATVKPAPVDDRNCVRAELAQDPRKSTEMIFVTVCDDDALDRVTPLEQVS